MFRTLCLLTKKSFRDLHVFFNVKMMISYYMYKNRLTIFFYLKAYIFNWNQQFWISLFNQLESSTLLKKLKVNPNDPSIDFEFKRWKFAKKVVIDHLVRRRIDESALYFKET